MSKPDDIPADVTKEAREMFKKLSRDGSCQMVHEYMAHAILAERKRGEQRVKLLLRFEQDINRSERDAAMLQRSRQ